MASTINYEFGLSPQSRLSFNVGGRGQFSSENASFFGTFSSYYQHVWNVKGGLNFYLGAGLAYDYGFANNPLMQVKTNNLRFGPQFGLEYDFNQHNVPLLLSFDISPTLGYDLNLSKGFVLTNNFGISLKYTIGNKK